REAALWLSAAAGVAATRRRTSEPQTRASGVPGGGTDVAAKEAEALRTRGKAAAGADCGEPGVGFGFCARCGGVRTSDPGVECGGRLHARVSGAGGGH